MNLIRQEGKTIEEAIEIALEKLGIKEEEADVKVVDEGSKGILGLIGARNAVVEVKVKVNPVQIGKEFLEKILEKMSCQANVEVDDSKTNQEQIYYNITGPDLGIVIGHRGETLDAIQYLTSLVVNKHSNKYWRILIDAEGYRLRREETLERLARRLAEKAITTGRKVVLEPMPPHERRIIHMALREDKRISTYSEGREPFRRILIERMDKAQDLDN